MLSDQYDESNAGNVTSNIIARKAELLDMIEFITEILRPIIVFPFGDVGILRYSAGTTIENWRA